MTYRLRPEARWHDGKPVTAEDVIFSFETLKANSPTYAFYYTQRGQGREDRRARGHLHLRREGQPRTAADRRAAAGAAEALVGGHGARRAQARHHRRPRSSRRSAPAPTGSRASTPAAPPPTSACSDYWGKRSAREPSAGTISTRSATNIFATRPCCSKPSRAIATTSAPRTAPATGRRPTTSRPCRKAASCWRSFPMRATGVDAGLRAQPAPRQVPGRSACAAPSTSPSTSRTSTARSSSASTSASTRYFFGTRARLLRAAARARSSRSSKACATRCRHRSSRRLTQNPVNGSPEAVRNEPARGRCACCKEAGCELKDRQLRQQATGEPSPSSSSATTRTSSASSCPTSRRSSASASALSVRIVDDVAVPEPRCAASTSTSPRGSVAAVAVARQRAARVLGLAGRRPAGLAQPRRHQGSRASTR